MAISLSREALLSRLKTLIQRFKHTAAIAGNDLDLKQVKSDGRSKETDTFSGNKLDAKAMGITQGKISPSSCSVLQKLKKAGFEAYLVGGCVRDLILNKVPKDFDVITTAELEDVKRLFKCSLIIGNKFPICRVPIKDSVLEVSSFQTGMANFQTRKAKGKKQNFSQMPQGLNKKDARLWRDAMRRDFTVNSLFYDPFANKIYDYAGGVKDLRSLELRTLIPAHISFTEDCARILRGLRIAARIGLSISGQTETAILKFSSSIASLPKSRLMMEMNYMLSYGAAEASLCLLCRFHLLKTLLPLHAAHLAQQITGKSDMNSLYLMRLFSNLDKLVTCDRPSDSTLWVAILAFHLSLLKKPQDPLVIWTFGSLLYDKNLPEAVKFAREKAEVPVISFLPEISRSFRSMSDRVIIQTVHQLSTSVQSSARALGTNSSVYIPRNTGTDTAELFSSILKKSNKSVRIDHCLLGKGDLSMTRRALGKIILDTMSSFLCQSDDNFVNKNLIKKPIQLDNAKGSNVGVLHNVENKQTGSIQSPKKKNQEPTKIDKEGETMIGLVLGNEENKQGDNIQIVKKMNQPPIKLENTSGAKVGRVEKNKQVHSIQIAKKNHHPIKLENARESKIGVVLHSEKIEQVDGIESVKKKNQQFIQLENTSGSKVGVLLHKDNKQTEGIQSARKRIHSPIKLENTSGKVGVVFHSEINKQVPGIQSTKKNHHPIKLENASGSKIGVVLPKKIEQVDGIESMKKQNRQSVQLENSRGSKVGVGLHKDENKQTDGIQSKKKKNQPPIKLENSSGSKVGMVLNKDKIKQTDGIRRFKKMNQPPIKLENTGGVKVGVVLHSEKNKQVHGKTHHSIKLENVSGTKIGVVLPTEKIEQVDGIESVKKKNQQSIQLKNTSGSKVGIVLHKDKSKQTDGIQGAKKKNQPPSKLENTSGAKVGVVLYSEKNKQVHGFQSAKKNHHPIKLENTSGSKIGVAFHSEKINQVHGIQSVKYHHPIKLENASGSKIGVVLHPEKIEQIDGIKSMKKQNQQSIHLENTSGSKAGHQDKNKRTDGIESVKKKNQPPIKLDNTSGAKVRGVVLPHAENVDHNQSVKEKNEEPLKVDKEKNNQVEGIQCITKKYQKPIKLEQTLGSKDGVLHHEESKQADDGTESVKKNEEHVNVSKVGKADPITHGKKGMDQTKPNETKQNKKVKSSFRPRLSSFFR